MARKKATAYVFLDTNMFLEFKDFDQIDWPAVLGYQEVCLVIAPIVLTELDKFKSDKGSNRRQKRSRAAIKKLEATAETTAPEEPALVPGRSGVKLILLANSPRVAAYAGLQPEIADDQLIASILQFRGSRPYVSHEDVFLLTDDAGARTKARHHHINLHRLDDAYRLPDEPTEAERDVARLKREVEELRNRHPKLALRLVANDQQAEELGSVIDLVREPSAEHLDRLVDIEIVATETSAKAIPGVDEPGTKAGQGRVVLDLEAIRRFTETTKKAEASDSSVKWVSKSELQKYEAERREYLEAYREYLPKLGKWQRRVGLLRRVDLLLVNDGTLPANGIIVQLFLPHELQAIDMDRRPRQPRPPERPEQPLSPGEQMKRSMDGIRAILAPAYTFPRTSSLRSEPDEEVADIQPSGKSIKWRVAKVTHQLPYPLGPFFIAFPPEEGERRYRLTYRLHADELAKPVEGTLTLVVTGLPKDITPPSAPVRKQDE